MKLITNTQITVDGVMQANGGNNPELDPGFDRGGWAIPTGDEESTAYIGDYLPARRRVPVRPAHLRAVRRLLGRANRFRRARSYAP